MFTSSESDNLLSLRFAYLKSTSVSIVDLKSIPDRLVLKRNVSERFVPVRSCLERSTLERFALERSFPFRLVLERSMPAKLTLCKSVLSSRFELSKFAKANLAPSIFAFLKLVLLRSALSKTAFCRFKLSKFQRL